MTATATNNLATNLATGETGFYVTGGTLRRDAPCYVERRADQALYDGLWQGQFCYVLTSRQMGKSSLMVRTAARLREADAHVVVLDLTSIGQNLNAEQWYDGLLNRVGRQLGLEDELEDYWTEHPRLGPLQRWMSALHEVVLPQRAGRLVFFVDEIDAVRSLPFSTDEFFAAIRELYNRRTEDAELERLTFCLLGVASPSDLIRDTRTTPFNIGQRIELNDFNDAEAAPLARGMGRDDKMAAKLLKRILYWTGGHPYLTQRLCQAVAEDAGVQDAGGVDRLCEELFFTTRARERDDNLLFVRERMLKSEADRAALLDLYKKLRDNQRVKDDETNPLISVLRLSGITRVAEGLLYVRNRIYYRVFDREWVLANLPDAEVLRQRAAYRRGLLRAAAVAAVILAIVGGLAFTAFRQRNRAVQSEQVNRRLLYSAQMNLAGQDLANDSFGRVRELLNAHIPAPGQEDLRGFEWFHLWRTANKNFQKLNHQAMFIVKSFSPDGKRMAALDIETNLTIWDTTTWTKLKTLSGFDYRPQFTPDGHRLIAADLQSGLRMWDLTTDQEIKINEAVAANAFIPIVSSDGIKLAIGYQDGTIKVWGMNTWQELLSISAHPGNRIKQDFSLDYSPDGKYLASCAQDGVIKIWDAITGKEIRAFNVSPQYHFLRFSPDSRSLAYTDQSLIICDVATGHELVRLKNERGLFLGVTFSSDGKMIAAVEERFVKVWDAKTGRQLHDLKGLSDRENNAAFLDGGKKVVVVERDATVLTWDIASQSTPESLAWETVASYPVFSPNGKTFVTTTEDGVARICEAATGKELFALNAFRKETGRGLVAISPDGKRLVTATSFDDVSDTNDVKIWDLETQQLIQQFQPEVPRGSWIAGLSRDGERVVTVSQTPDAKIVRAWDIKTKQELFSVKEDIRGNVPFRTVFSPDGKLAAIGTIARVQLCDVSTGKVLRSYETSLATMELAFSPDGEKLAVGSWDGDVSLLDIKTGRTISNVRGHAGMTTSVAFSPDGNRFASSSDDKKVKIWDAENGQELLTLSGHTKEVWSVAFSPDGKTLLSTSADKTIRFWRAATEQEVLARRGQ